MFYVELRYTAERTAEVEVDTRCACGAAFTARVVGRAVRTAASPYGLEANTEQRAQEYAQRAAERAAREAIEIAKCPSCGKRNAAAALRFVARRSVAVVGVLALFGLLALVLSFAPGMGATMHWIVRGLLGFGSLFALVLAQAGWSEWSAANRSVAFNRR